MVSLMTAPFFGVLRPQDRVAVKLHVSPVFHATQYLMGRQTPDKMERFRAFASMVKDYVRLKGLSDQPQGRMVALVNRIHAGSGTSGRFDCGMDE